MVLVKLVRNEGADGGKGRVDCKEKIDFRVERFFVGTQLTHSKFYICIDGEMFLILIVILITEQGAIIGQGSTPRMAHMIMMTGFQM